MKKIYVTPAFFAVELTMEDVTMLAASDESGTIIPGGGTGDGTDIGAKEKIDVNLWDDEW